ncbi:hypothetical protein NAF17_10865 [Mucilaginibacter sp. RB4R14]|uniref:hypothetical protein n=1 Tax=Mucilaginibacter aurantiaciroseus TaxID=2949308 RepID=UPI002090A68F|nr:hypothetical protein [Mucilaginibacter aurantiaciroseus]MCO5936041.1 hypothetical protein [Mucilaginibacter aurantiaciroseus]
MNDTFNLTRFSLLLKKTVLERPVQLIGLMGLILCFTLILYSLVLYSIDYGSAQNISFIWGFIGGGTVLASFVFGYFNTNAGGSAYLTLPASALEKWLCSVLIAGIFFLVIFLSFYRVMDYIFVTAYHKGLDHTSPLYQRLYDHVYLYPLYQNNVVNKVYIIWANCAGVMLIGSLYFNRVAIVKVSLLVCVVLGCIYFLNLAVASALFSNIDVAFPFYTVLIKVRSEVGVIQLPQRAYQMSDIFINYILPATLWITAYIRLREKEI